jgi:hypothetical protein
MGYVIQPRRNIPIIVVLRGGGDNGKTVLVRTLIRLLGDQLVRAQRVEDLDKNRFAMGSLFGKLLFVDDDVRAGVRLPDGTLKTISEAKEVTGELKFKQPFNFVVRTVPMMLCNNVPSLADLSQGMLRRLNIPATTAKMVIAQLKDRGYVTRGWMGVQVQAVTADLADSLGLKNAEGAIVDEPQAGSPAARAGIKEGDVITSVDGKDIKDARMLARSISGIAPGTEVKLGVWHNGDTKTVSLTLGQLPNDRQANAAIGEGDNTATDTTPRLGLTLAPANEVGGAGTQGVAITAVDPNGPAAEHGMQTGDVILDVGGKTVAKPADVRQELAALHQEGKHTVLMRVKSGDGTKFVAIPFGKA